MSFADEESRLIRRMTEKRLEKGWSQNEFARKLQEVGLNWKQPTVDRVEKGTRPLRFTEALAIAKFFGETVESMSAPEEFTRWQLLVREAAVAMLAERLVHYQWENERMEERVIEIYGRSVYEDLPKPVAKWVDWISHKSPTTQASLALYDHDFDLYEAAAQESGRIFVSSMHSVPK